MSIKFADQSPVYRDFRSIPYRDFHYVVYFYREHFEQISQLDYQERLIIQYYLCNAYFQIEDYDLFLQFVDTVIEASLVYNVDSIDGEDVLSRMFYQKALALQALERGDRAKEMASSLLRMHPYIPRNRRLLKQILWKNKPYWLSLCFSMGLMISLVGLSLYAVLLLFVAPFYPTVDAGLHYLVLGTTLGSALCFTLSYWGYERHVQQCIRQQIKEGERKQRANLELINSSKGNKVRN